MPSTVLFARDCGAFGMRLTRYEPGRRMPRHCHDTHGISVILGGELVEEAHNCSVNPRAGWAVVKPAGTYHENRFGPAPVAILNLAFREPLHEEQPLVWSWFDRATVFRSAMRLLRVVRRGLSANQDDALAELAASLQELPRGGGSAWLERVKAALDECPSPSRLPISALAADAGVHPIYLARRFRAAYGVSLREYRQIAQVRRATQLILGTRRSLSEIAHDCDFADHSHMCRSFRVVAGTRPAALRH